jgi:hypothetical protein
VKRSLLVEAEGGPLGAVVAAANVPDFTLLEATLEAVVVPRPQPSASRPQHLCLDKGYDNDTGWGVALEHDYEPHIALIRDLRPPRPQRHPARRWVVETTQPQDPRDSRLDTTERAAHARCGGTARVGRLGRTAMRRRNLWPRGRGRAMSGLAVVTGPPRLRRDRPAAGGSSSHRPTPTGC